MKHTRRQMIGGLALAALAAPFRRMGAAESVPESKVVLLTGRRLGLTAARVINTAQIVHQKQLGRFGTFADLSQPAVREAYVRLYAPEIVQKVRFRQDDVVDGFRAVLHLSGGGRNYRLFIIELAASEGRSFAYLTDDTGVVQEGSVRANNTRLIRWTSSGSPLTNRRNPPQKVECRLRAWHSSGSLCQLSTLLPTSVETVASASAGLQANVVVPAA